MKKTGLLSILLLMVCCLSCKKDEEPKPVETPVTPAPVASDKGSVKIVLRHMANGELLQFQKKYLNSSFDTFAVNKFMYYISNIKLVKSDGTKHSIPNSYHLVDHSKSGSMTITLTDVPNANYTSLNFVLGVDSTRNCSGAQSGDLDPAKGMFWSWSTGYIFYKLEGQYPSSSGTKGFTYHVGGFKGANKTQRDISLGFLKSAAQVTSDHTPVITLDVLTEEIFDTPTKIDIFTQNYQMSEGPQAKVLADNCSDMFKLNNVAN